MKKKKKKQRGFISPDILLLPPTCEKLMGDQVGTTIYVFNSQNVQIISTGHSYFFFLLDWKINK